MLDEATKTKIIKLHTEEKLTQEEIGNLLKLGAGTIFDCLKEAGVNRSHSESLRVSFQRGRRGLNKAVLLPKVINLYRDHNYTQAQVAGELGISSTMVKEWLTENHLVRSRKDRTPKGSRHYCWNGGRNDKHGYTYVKMPEHPAASKTKGYVAEHRLVWEQVHNKLLPEGWVIHHLNGVRSDNRPENLIACSRGEHIHLSEPFKKRIRALEAKVKLLERALEQNQLIFNIGEN